MIPCKPKSSSKGSRILVQDLADGPKWVTKSIVQNAIVSRYKWQVQLGDKDSITLMQNWFRARVGCSGCRKYRLVSDDVQTATVGLECTRLV